MRYAVSESEQQTKNSRSEDKLYGIMIIIYEKSGMSERWTDGRMENDI